MLAPKKTKHRKAFVSVLKPDAKATQKIHLAFGSYGLKSQSAKWVTARQIEAARRAIMRYLKRGGLFWIRIFPDKPITSKSGEVPMGKGKGAVDHYVSVVKAGTVMFEIDGVSESEAREAFRLASHKLPMKTTFVKKQR